MVPFSEVGKEIPGHSYGVLGAIGGSVAGARKLITNRWIYQERDGATKRHTSHRSRVF